MRAWSLKSSVASNVASLSNVVNLEAKYAKRLAHLADVWIDALGAKHTSVLPVISPQHL
jgi:hypothetical protein